MRTATANVPGVELSMEALGRLDDGTAAEQALRPLVARYHEWIEARRAGVLHAKAVVVDDEAVFVTSANLTGAALDLSIEIGLLVRDRTLAATMARHFTTLIEQSLLHPLPGMR